MAQRKHMTSHVLTINRTRTQAHDNSGMSELSPTKIKPDRSNRTLTVVCSWKRKKSLKTFLSVTLNLLIHMWLFSIQLQISVTGIQFCNKNTFLIMSSIFSLYRPIKGHKSVKYDSKTHMPT